MLIQAAYCSLVRFACPGCGKTFSFYPDFAIPYKHYTRPTITGFSAGYVESDDTTYQQAVMIDRSAPGYPQSDLSAEAATSAPSTIHRWITTLSRFTDTCRTALMLLLEQNPVSSICRDLARLVIGRRKYHSDTRKKQLTACRQLVIISSFFSSRLQNIDSSRSWQPAAPFAELCWPPWLKKGGMHLDKEQEKWAIFWCDLLSPLIYDEIEAELTNRTPKSWPKKRSVTPTGESAPRRFGPCAAN